MKKILLFTFFCLSIKFYAQTSSTSSNLVAASYSYNKYLVKIDPSISYNTDAVANYLKQICGTNLVSYTIASQYFQVLTTKVLEKNIIDGKLYKNSTPLYEFISVGEVKVTPSENVNTIGAE